jgi:hypothetical protein
VSSSAWTPVDESAVKAAWTPVEEPPKEDSFLHKAWKALNTPVADLLSTDGNTKRAILGALGQQLGIDLSPENLAYQAQRTDTKHPAVQGIRTFLAGSVGDTASTAAGLTSPLSLGTAAIGGATQLPRAAGTVAKAAMALNSGAIAGKGVSDIASAGISNTPEAWQQRLNGGAMVAGGAAGMGSSAQALKPVVSRGLLLGRTPQEAYQSALKPSTALSEAERAKIVDTGLREKIPVSAKGLDDLHDLIDDVNSQIRQTISTDPARPVNPAQAVQNLRGLRSRFATQVNPKADLEAIDQSGQEFLDQFRSQAGGAVRNMTAEEAQAMKQGTYRALGDKAYGELKGASIEAQKALARGLKEELARRFPELEKLNARDSALLDLQPVLERAVNRIGNHQLIGIGTPITTGATKALTGSGKLAAVAGVMKAVLDNPAVKSRLAISLGKAGAPLAQARLRIAAYSSALAPLAAGVAAQSAATSPGQSTSEQP